MQAPSLWLKFLSIYSDCSEICAVAAMNATSLCRFKLLHSCVVAHLQTTDFELRRLVIDEFGKVSAAANGIDSGGGNWEEHGTIFSYVKSGTGGQEVEKQTVFGPSNAIIRSRAKVNDVSCLHPVSCAAIPAWVCSLTNGSEVHALLPE